MCFQNLKMGLDVYILQTPESPQPLLSNAAAPAHPSASALTLLQALISWVFLPLRSSQTPAPEFSFMKLSHYASIHREMFSGSPLLTLTKPSSLSHTDILCCT